MNYLDEKLGATSYPLKRIWRKFLCVVQRSQFIPTGVRVKLLRLAGIRIGDRTFIGADVDFDGIRPDLIAIGNHVGITAGCKILTHFIQPADNAMILGKVIIEDDVFMGVNTLIVAPVTIGHRSLLAAGSVVICDIPSGEIWGGNPARKLKDRPYIGAGTDV